VGCGPVAIAVRLAALAAQDGAVWAVDRDADALTAASALAERSAVRLHTRSAAADDTGLLADAFDLVMLRHVLAHNGGREQAIIDHLAALTKPGGGAVYLVDLDASAFRVRAAGGSALEEINERYWEMNRRRGNDVTVGTRLDERLTAAGLDLVEFEGHISVLTSPPGMRGPAWAARDALVADGLATPDEIVRWDNAFQRAEQDKQDIKLFTVEYVAYARRP
jgi:SAM-dependent methyltransferase